VAAEEFLDFAWVKTADEILAALHRHRSHETVR